MYLRCRPRGSMPIDDYHATGPDRVGGTAQPGRVRGGGTIQEYTSLVKPNRHFGQLT